MRCVKLAVALAMTLAIAGCAGGTNAETGASMAASQTSSEEIQSTQDASPTSQDLQGEEYRSETPGDELKTPGEEASAMRLSIDGADVAVEWEDNESVSALAALASDGPLAIQMSMYGGFEQVGSLGTTLPSDDAQTTTGAGDIVLYSGNQIVVFYGSNSWAYTRLGHITDRTPDEMANLLGNGDVALTITTE